MDIPDESLVRRLLGTGVALRRVEHWIPGRSGLVYVVEADDEPRRSVFKWVSPAELTVCRELLPAAPINTPRLLGSWDAAPEHPPAVRIEYIPHLAVPGPCYRLSPEHVPLTGPAWRGGRMDDLFAQLGRLHARYVGGRGLQAHADCFRRPTVDDDLADWRTNIEKLRAVAHMPGAAEWIDFWAPREQAYRRVLDELARRPVTWCWRDAKWDHVGCREDGAVVVLELENVLAPGGSDLFLCLYEPPARRAELLAAYASAAEGMFEESDDLREYVRLGLHRACYVHGPGQACLSIRGVAGGGSSDEDRRAWARDAQITAENLLAFEDGSIELF